MMYMPDKSVQESEGYRAILEFKQKLALIEEKNRCVRVQFLDWLSVKLASWSTAVKAASDRIDSPCVIKVKRST